MKRLLFIGVFILLVVIGCVTTQNKTVTYTDLLSMTDGDIRGKVTQDPDIELFAALPFAAPPVGDLRWRAPQPPLKWQGVRDASEFSLECAQNTSSANDFLKRITKGLGFNWLQQRLALRLVTQDAKIKRSEDCLYLNVRTGNRGKKELQPVMVWIHGGGHANGSGTGTYYQTNGLVKNGVVVVTINYRLGPFGYLAHPALSAESAQGISGNYGLLDQIAALQWVKENISQFGGDPDNVTIFGESAGAQSVSEILASPLSKGLVHKAILQSGASSGNLRYLKYPTHNSLGGEETGARFLADLTPHGRKATPAQLRAIPTQAILDQMDKMPILADDFYPYVDGVVLPKQIGLAMKDGDFPYVAMLAGYNADEGSLFYTGSPTTLQWTFPEGYEKRIARFKELYGKDRAERLIELYQMGSPQTYANGATDLLGDDLFGVHMRFLAKQRAKYGQPTYMYFFSRLPPNKGQTIGAFHASEIAFVFDSHLSLPKIPQADRTLTKEMGLYWTNFAKTGDPNGNGLPVWPQFSQEEDVWLNLDHEIKIIHNLRKEKLDIIESVLEDYIEATRPLLASTGNQIVEQDIVEVGQ